MAITQRRTLEECNTELVGELLSLFVDGDIEAEHDGEFLGLLEHRRRLNDVALVAKKRQTCQYEANLEEWRPRTQVQC